MSRPPERLRDLRLDIRPTEPDVLQHVIAELSQLPALP
jgi:hypothetical protein